jgi:hypothetical protein
LALCGAVVETVSVVVPLPVIDAGLKLQLLRAGKPAQDPEVKLTVPLKPDRGLTVKVRVPD